MLSIKEMRCPSCDKPLEIMALYFENDKLVVLLHCEECKDDVDADWKFTCKIEKIERYFFG